MDNEKKIMAIKDDIYTEMLLLSMIVVEKEKFTKNQLNLNLEDKHANDGLNYLKK